MISELSAVTVTVGSEQCTSSRVLSLPLVLKQVAGDGTEKNGWNLETLKSLAREQIEEFPKAELNYVCFVIFLSSCIV